jgi:hypothetical protein
MRKKKKSRQGRGSSKESVRVTRRTANSVVSSQEPIILMDDDDTHTENAMDKTSGDKINMRDESCLIRKRLGSTRGCDDKKKWVIVHKRRGELINWKKITRMKNDSDDTWVMYSMDSSIELRVSDFFHLKYGEYFNDNIINAFVQLIRVEARPKGYLIFNSFFMSKLTSQQSVRFWLSKAGFKPHQVNKILFVIHDEPVHFAAMEVDMREKYIRLYDSLGSNSNADQYFSVMKAYIIKTFHIELNGWRFENTDDDDNKEMENIPRQGHGLSCGAFALFNVLYRSRDLVLDYHSKPKLMRQYITECILGDTLGILPSRLL